MEEIKNTQYGERLSFYKLFCKKPYRVLIPIIQRDYAQGRKTTMEVREEFLEALIKYLKDDEPNRDLDFVYGSLKKTDEKTNEFIDFIPLDGQQRLTTLFLLHWYLCQISDKTNRDKYKKVLIPDDKNSMFTYETRTSSSHFCNSLMSADNVLNNLLKADEDSNGDNKKNILSKTIENSSWFFLSWKNDPTIMSMLIMLDAIHNKFDKLPDKNKYFERLIDTENPIITFLFLNLEDFKLTDELYIKMNSRGKQLTTFENFKAKFEKYLNNVPNIGGKYDFYGNKEKTVEKYFSHNIDIKWTDLFWIYKDTIKKSNDDQNTYDEEISNFIRVIFTTQYALNEPERNFEFLSGDESAREKEDYTDKVSFQKNKEFKALSFEFLLGTKPAREREGYTDKISFHKYEDLKALSNEGVYYLIDTLDALKIENNKLKSHLSDNYKYYYEEETVFENALKHSINHRDRVTLHAYIRFLIKNGEETAGLDNWMRVIHNLSYNSPLDNADQVAGAFKSVEKMLQNSGNILAYLKNLKNNDVPGFSTWQSLEEKIKAHLITRDKDWKNIIESTEQFKCFDGQIGFILEFSGIVDYYITHNYTCDWDDKDNKVYFDKFNKYAKKAITVFNDKDNKDSYNKNYVWERAVLTKGDYLIKTSSNPYSNRKSLLTKTENKRDISWKRLLRIKDDGNKQKRQYVQNVFDDDLFVWNNIQNSLENICKTKTNSWRDCLISRPELISYCGNGYIEFKDDKDIILLSQSQINAPHSEMYSLYLWYESFKDKENEFKLFKHEYFYSNDSESPPSDPPCIILNDYCHNSINYEIRIYFNNHTFPKFYEIAFRLLDIENIQDNYGPDIKEILTKKLNFIWEPKESGYVFTDGLSKPIMEKLEKLNKELLELTE